MMTSPAAIASISLTRPRPYGSSANTVLMLGDMTIQRMDNVAIVVDDLDATVAFFTEPGMEPEGKGQVEGLSHVSVIRQVCSW
jgi:hypothetical protein